MSVDRRLKVATKHGSLSAELEQISDISTETKIAGLDQMLPSVRHFLKKEEKFSTLF